MAKILRLFLILVTFFVNLPYAYAQESDGSNLKNGFQTAEKGVFTNSTELTRPEGFAAVLDNLHCRKDGVWTDRGFGWVKQNASPFNSGSQFVEISEQTSRTRGVMIVMQVGDKVYAYDGTTATDITGDTVPAVGHYPCIRTFVNPGGNYCLFCNDNAEPCFTYDGSIAFFSPIPTGPQPPGTPNSGFPCTIGGKTYSKPTFCEGHYGRVVFAGFAAHPNTLLLSTPINGYDFSEGVTPEATDAGAIDVPSNLGEVTGLCPLRVGNGTNDQILLIGCSKGVGILTGSDATNFAVKELTRAYGIPNNRTWVPLGDNELFVATDGIRRIANSAYGANVVGTPVSYPVQNLVKRINFNATDGMYAVNNRATQELQFWIPIDSETTNKNVIVANYRTSTGQDLIFSTMSGVNGACGIYVDANSTGSPYQGMWIGGYDGNIQNWYFNYDKGDGGDYGPENYDGVAIHWTYVSGIIGANSFAQSSSMKKFIIACDDQRQKFLATAYVYVTNSDGTTRRLQLQSSKHFNYDDFTLPVTTWDNPAVGSHNHPSLFDYSCAGSGRLWFIKLEGNPNGYVEGESGDTIGLVGVQSIQSLGGMKQ